MKEICNKDFCTACNACVLSCPRNCITMQEDNIGALHPVINQEQCVDCGACVRTCPNNKTLDFHDTIKIYAAWSKDELTRQKSASGGVAAELYKRYISLGPKGFCVGVRIDANLQAVFCQITDFNEVQNSKYVYSNTQSIYKTIKDKLKENIEVLFVGLPCQVAGLYSYLNKEYPNLLTVDLVCHGVAPSDYLVQHIHNIEKEKQEKANQVSFRDWRFNTDSYTFTLSDSNDNIIYKRKVYEDDVYQLGYHNSLIYRENCYKCKYAQRKRVSDLTLCDFTSVGAYNPFHFEKSKVSCILVNTERGEQIIQQISDNLYKEERPKDEIFDFESQLNSPYKAHVNREVFLENYIKTRDFDHSAYCALKSDIEQYYASKSLKGRTLMFMRRIYHFLRRIL